MRIMAWTCVVCCPCPLSTCSRRQECQLQLCMRLFNLLMYSGATVFIPLLASNYPLFSKGPSQPFLLWNYHWKRAEVKQHCMRGIKLRVSIDSGFVTPGNNHNYRGCFFILLIVIHASPDRLTSLSSYPLITSVFTLSVASSDDQLGELSESKLTTIIWEYLSCATAMDTDLNFIFFDQHWKVINIIIAIFICSQRTLVTGPDVFDSLGVAVCCQPSHICRPLLDPRNWHVLLGCEWCRRCPSALGEPGGSSVCPDSGS